MNRFAVALVLAATLPLVACGEGDDMDNPFGSTATDSVGDGDGDGDPGDGDGDGDGDPGDGDGDGDGDPGDGDGDGDPPLACEFAAGCHMPDDPATDVGLASHAPVGCEGPSFKITASLNVNQYADPEAPRSVPYLGDFDGDGHPDLLVNFRKSGVGLVFPNDGQGNFAGQPSQLAGGLFAGGWGGDIGDFTNDGNLDILLGDHTRSGRAWSGNGSMGFSEARNGLPDNVWFSGAGLADLNGDGNLDAIFGADQFASGFQVYYGNGAGSWSGGTAPPASGASNIGYFAFDDYDDDGDIDIFAFGKGQGGDVTSYVFANTGASFSLVGTYGGGAGSVSGADPVQGGIGDVNCDGITDIAAGGTIYLGNGNSWTQGAVVDESSISHLADMNGDGHLDLVTQHKNTGISLHINDGTGQNWTLDTDSGLPDLNYQQLGTPIVKAYGIDVDDLDGNGNLDVVRIAGFGSSYLVEAWTR